MRNYKFTTKHFIIIVILICALSITIRVWCDEIHLKNGNSIKGVITTESKESITMEVSIGSFTIPKSDIESIDRDRLEKDKETSTEKIWHNFSTPENTFNSYMYACKVMDFEKSDLCFTREFQNFAKTNKEYLSHRNTGQLRNAYNYWHGKPYKIEMYGDKAIMRFSPEFKRPEPFYFVEEGGEWKIDGMFSFRNVIIEDSGNWFWRYPNVDNEKQWIRK